MKTRRRPWRPDLMSEFWFLTSLVSAAGVVLALLVLAVDKHAGEAGFLPGLVVSPDSARTILGSIAGSLITIASLTSSLTIVTLQLLSSQYTPRTVRGFLATRRAQLVLGLFIGVFLYCLVLLVAVREPGDENQPFVPSLGIVVSVVLAVVGLIALVLFLHTMSQTIQVSTMTSGVARETRDAIDRLHDNAGARVAPGPVDLAEPAARRVRAGRTGWIRHVETASLAETLARSAAGTTVVVVARPGDFVSPGDVVALVGPDAEASSPLVAAVERAVVVERERDMLDDPLYGIRQLVDIALRALSPGINDPTTAITCLGYLRALTEDVAPRPLPPLVEVAPGLSVARPTFEDYLLPLAEAAAYAGSDARVATTVVEALESVASCCTEADRADRVRRLADEVRDAAVGDLRLPSERARLAGSVRASTGTTARPGRR